MSEKNVPSAEHTHIQNHQVDHDCDSSANQKKFFLNLAHQRNIDPDLTENWYPLSASYVMDPKMLEKLAAIKESEWQKLARTIGSDPATTTHILEDMLAFSGEGRTLAPACLVYHQMTYWRIIEFGGLPVLQAVINSFVSIISKHIADLDMLTHIFSEASLLLYALCNNGNSYSDEMITVEPIDPKEVENHTRNHEKKALHPLRSSSDFFAQLKGIVARCFGLLLAHIASKLDPLLESTILIDNFASNAEIPSLAPIVDLLQKALSFFQVNMVHLSISQQFFSEVFLRINKILMNGVLLKQQFCTEAFGIYLKHRIEHLQNIADEMGQMWIGNTENGFQGIKQIAAVLALQDKAQLVEEKHRKHLCPNLNTLQLRQLLAMFTPGEFGKRVPISVINSVSLRSPTTESDRILRDVNVVRPIPVRVLHYFMVEDMQKLVVTPGTRALVEGLANHK